MNFIFTPKVFKLLQTSKHPLNIQFSDMLFLQDFSLPVKNELRKKLHGAMHAWLSFFSSKVSMSKSVMAGTTIRRGFSPKVKHLPERVFFSETNSAQRRRICLTEFAGNPLLEVHIKCGIFVG